MGKVIDLKEYKNKQKQEALEELDPNLCVDNMSIVQAIGLIYSTLCNIPADVVNSNKYTKSDFDDLMDIEREIKEIIYQENKQ